MRQLGVFFVIFLFLGIGIVGLLIHTAGPLSKEEIAELEAKYEFSSFDDTRIARRPIFDLQVFRVVQVFIARKGQEAKHIEFEFGFRKPPEAFQKKNNVY